MSINKPAAGTRGARMVPGFLGRLLTPLMVGIHRLTGNRLRGVHLVYLHTTGARTGKKHVTPVARFDDGSGGWFVVASAGGAATHPGWYHNIAAHPDQVVAEIDGRTMPVDIEQLEAEERAAAWVLITGQAKGFAAYENRTDRVIPVLRLTARA